ncbi:hypothetical protein NB539_17710 [Vibrio parahaemolyticus]|uniref:hypothetical protein n=1 Tax=Vibrio parahaemolyticus TaxID=670 RepID=UPI000A5A1C42|nr:hypothetical protein [Vibrio parahaemolyticus]MCS0033967.1 hypothetical protein [Vibrio parahaemolyticus]WMN74139.1 hypothetical protein NI386_23200 [Vibrio parahaemolyticus]
MKWDIRLYINKVFNVGDAWDALRENNATELSELQVALANLGYVDSIKAMKDGVLSNLHEMEWRCRNYLVGGRASFKEFKAAPSEPKMTQMGALKGEVAIDIGMNIPTSLDSWVTFRSKSASSLGLIPVLIMPLDVGEDSSFRMSFDYVVQRIQYLDIVEGNSFLILGCSYDYSDIEVIDSDKVIRRTITFEPHQIQAGVGLLSYFSEVLKQKCSEANSKVSIEQDGEKVRLRIKSDAGTEHKVEALLNEYGEVLNGTRQPEQLMTDQVQLLSLQNKLDMAAMEVKHQQSILALTKSNYDQRIFSLEEQVEDLKHMLSESITSHRIAQDQVSKLIDKYGSNSDVELELLGLAKKLDERAADVQKEELERIVKQLHMDNPKLAAEFLSLLKGPLEGVAGNIIYSWLPQLGSIIGMAIR